MPDEPSARLEQPLLETREGRGKRDARLPSLARGQHPKGRVLGQPLGVVGVLVAGESGVDRLTEEVRHRELPIVASARISEMPFDQRVQTEAFVQLTRQ